MRRRIKCKKEVLENLKENYDKIVTKRYMGDYLRALHDFNKIAESELRKIMEEFYKKQRSGDQAWKSCKGSLYEYAVFKFLKHTITNDKVLKDKYDVIMGDKVLEYKNQIVIRNWNEIFPDVDILIIEKTSRKVEVIVSCKTSLRERLTETAFWKRELERFQNTKDIRLIFITTDKDKELRIDTNRYILLHVIDCTFVTDPQRYDELIKNYKKKYGKREDFPVLCSKVRLIDDIRNFLYTLT